MITCKEDLINTAVFCKRGELRDLYIKKCGQLGIDWEHNLDINNYSFLYVKEDMRLHGVQTVTDSYYLHLKRLTLSDLKPRTKTVYEKVTFNEDYEHLVRMIKGESFYDCRGEIKYKFNGYGFVCTQEGSEYKDVKWDTKRPAELYRQTEVEIDWRDELISEFDFISFNASCNSVHLKTWPPIKEQQFLEMCRVALRATGELE